MKETVRNPTTDECVRVIFLFNVPLNRKKLQLIITAYRNYFSDTDLAIKTCCKSRYSSVSYKVLTINMTSLFYILSVLCDQELCCR